MVKSLHLKGARLSSPPFDEDVLIMLATGWDYPTLRDTPQRVVEQIMLYHKIAGEYQEKQQRQDGDES